MEKNASKEKQKTTKQIMVWRWVALRRVHRPFAAAPVAAPSTAWP
jgi:hypothetical protein